MTGQGTTIVVACAAALLVILAVAPTASADVVVDFESGNPFSGGALSELYSTSATHSLFVTAGQGVTMAIPAEYLGGSVKVTMMVYDLGRWVDRDVSGFPTSVSGPRWGVSADDGEPGEYAGVTIMERGSPGGVPSEDGYGCSYLTGPAQGRFDSTWFSYSWYGGPRQCTLSDDGGSSVWNEDTQKWDWTMGTEGTGQWTEWTFEVTAAGVATFYREGGGTKTFDMGGSATEVWIYGGRNNATSGLPLADVYIDDVTIVPEPATMALLGLGLLGLVARRKK